MAMGLLKRSLMGLAVLWPAVHVFAADYNSNDPNLRAKPDGAMNYDQITPLDKVETTGGTGIIKKDTIPVPPPPKPTPSLKPSTTE
jgi:hypothetical protein